MKKYILTFAIISSIISCKKGEVSQAKIDEVFSKTDSTISKVGDKISETHENAEEVLDSAQFKIKNFENDSKEVKEKLESTYKSIDSLSQKIANTKLESKIDTKKDSSNKKNIKEVASPKIVKETKIIYKEAPKKDNYETTASQNKMVKTGVLEINVNDAETSKDLVKQELRKYDGVLKSENSTSYNDEKITYLKVKVPIQKFDYFIEELSNNIGEIENKNIETSGYNYIENTFCNVEITLNENQQAIVASGIDKNFGEKSTDAIGSGWNVITSIFLFILPFWPLFLIGGIVYYFYNKKKSTKQNSSISKQENDTFA